MLYRVTFYQDFINPIAVEARLTRKKRHPPGEYVVMVEAPNEQKAQRAATKAAYRVWEDSGCDPDCWKTPIENIVAR